MDTKCTVCEANYTKRIDSSKYCSLPCYWSTLKGVKQKPEHIELRRKGLLGHPVSFETRLKIRKAQLGSKSHIWRGGLSTPEERIRKGMFTKIWKAEVLKRDKYTCQQCGSTDNVVADHIKPFAHFPELRFELSNGRALCVPCHRKTITYGLQKTDTRLKSLLD